MTREFQPYLTTSAQTLSKEPSNHLQNFIAGFVSGALVSSVKSLAQPELGSTKKIQDGLKGSLQSGIAASMLASANAKIEQGHYLSALFSLSSGAVGIYIVERSFQENKNKDE